MAKDDDFEQVLREAGHRPVARPCGCYDDDAQFCWCIRTGESVYENQDRCNCSCHTTTVQTRNTNSIRDMLNTLKSIFVAPALTLEAARMKAERLGWRIEDGDEGYVLFGKDVDGRKTSWEYRRESIGELHSMLDHMASIRLGEAYRIRKYGLLDEPTDLEVTRRKNEIYDLRIRYMERCAQGRKPRWMHFFQW